MTKKIVRILTFMIILVFCMAVRVQGVDLCGHQGWLDYVAARNTMDNNGTIIAYNNNWNKINQGSSVLSQISNYFFGYLDSDNPHQFINPGYLKVGNIIDNHANCNGNHGLITNEIRISESLFSGYGNSNYAGLNNLIKSENRPIEAGTTYTVFAKYVVHGNQLISLDENNKVIGQSNDYSNGTMRDMIEIALTDTPYDGSYGNGVPDLYGQYSEAIQYYWNTWVETLPIASKKDKKKLYNDMSVDDYKNTLINTCESNARKVSLSDFVGVDENTKEMTAATMTLSCDEGSEYNKENVKVEKTDDNKYKIGPFQYEFEGIVQKSSEVIITNIDSDGKTTATTKYTFEELGLKINSEEEFSIKCSPKDGINFEEKFKIKINIKLSYTSWDGESIIPAHAAIIYVLKSNNSSPDLISAMYPTVNYPNIEKEHTTELTLDGTAKNKTIKVVAWGYKNGNSTNYKSKKKLKNVEFVVFYKAKASDKNYQYLGYENGEFIYKAPTLKPSEVNYENKPKDKYIFKTNNNGIKLEGVKEGIYWIKQIYTGSDNEEYCYRGITIGGENGKKLLDDTNAITFKLNNYYNVGKLSITKVDDDGKAWKDINFRITYKKKDTIVSDGNSYECGNGVHKDNDEEHFVREDNDSSNKNSYVSINAFDETYYDTDEKETYLTTDDSGKITIDKLYAGTYVVSELNAPEGYVLCIYKDKDGDGKKEWVELGDNVKEVEVTIKAGSKTTIKLKNKKKYIKLGGYVWEENSSNNLYDDKTKDKTFEGITVQLVDSTDTTKDFIKQTTTKADGSYELKDVEYANLSKYYIRFIYDGFTYNTVSIDTNKANGSKGTENTTDRTNLNNKFKFVTGLESNNVSGTTTTVNAVSDKDKTLALKYNTVAGQNGSADISTYVNEQWTYSVKPENPTSKQAERKAGEYDVSAKANITIPTDKRATKIYNINLGLVQKEQPDLKINYELTDVIQKIKDVESSINIQDTIIIPKSDIKTLTDNELSDKKLEVYLKYKIALQNEKNLDSAIYEIRGDYQNISSYEIENKTNLPDDISISIEDGKLKISTEKGIKLPANTAVEIPIIAKVSEEFLKSMEASEIQGGEVNESTVLNKNPIKGELEIYKYATFYKGTANLYAGLDVDSAVGNRSNFSNEDDTSNNVKNFATSWDIYRSISGFVFEDIPEGISEDIVNSGEERKGNGYYDNNDKGESKVENVLVELLEYMDVDAGELNSNYSEEIDNEYVGKSNVVFTYTKNEDSSSIDRTTITNENNPEETYYKSVAAMYTAKDGNYSFKGLLPGKYIIRFVWGDKVVYKRTLTDGTVKIKEEQTKIGDKEVTVQDYKSTIKVEGTEGKVSSIAVDNYQLRTDINKELENISYKIDTGYYEEDNKKYALKADTECIEIGIAVETKSDQAFGIIERPRQEIKVTKEISDVNLVLANGHPITGGPTRDENGNINNKLSYATYLKPGTGKGGILKMELDNELVHGSILEVTYKIIVENLSEIDYNDKDYYWFGKKPENENELVKTTITKMIDYMQNDGLVYKKVEDDGWECLTSSEFKDKVAEDELSNKAYGKAKAFSQILLLENSNELSNIQLGEKKYVSFCASRTIASSSEDLTYNNDVEVISLYNSVGRFMTSSTPGNHIPQENDTEIDNDNIDVAIVPPTGETRIYYVLGITSLLIIALGVVIIKKKVIG